MGYCILSATSLVLLASPGIGVEFKQEDLGITLVLDGQKAELKFLSGGQLILSVSLACWLSAYSSALLDTDLLPVVFYLVVDPLAFVRAMLPTQPIFFPILGFISHSTFWIFQNPG